jgi:hypothetical protein
MLVSFGLEFAQPHNGGTVDVMLFVASNLVGIFALVAYVKAIRETPA